MTSIMEESCELKKTGGIRKRPREARQMPSPLEADAAKGVGNPEGIRSLGKQLVRWGKSLITRKEPAA